MFQYVRIKKLLLLIIISYERIIHEKQEVYTYRKHNIDLLRIDRGQKELVCS